MGQLTLGFLFINLCKLYQQALSIDNAVIKIKKILK